MKRILLRTSVVVGVLGGALGVAGQAQRPTGVQPDVRFHSNVAEYMALRARIASTLPPLPARPTWLQISSTMAALADGIRTERRESDGRLFTDDLHRFFRELTEATLTEHDVDVRELLASFAEDAAPRVRRPRANEKYDWGTSAAMPPCILEAYPRLPLVLQYRFAGRDLLIIDIDAGLVVDILPRAIPKP